MKSSSPNDSIIRLMRSFYLQFAMLNVKNLDLVTKVQCVWKITTNHGKFRNSRRKRQNSRYPWIPWIRDL